MLKVNNYSHQLFMPTMSQALSDSLNISHLTLSPQQPYGAFHSVSILALRSQG